MLPSLIAREIKSELESFLSTSFPMTTAGFQRGDGHGLMEHFLQDSSNPDNLLKGPWLEIKLPFRTAEHTADSPLTHIPLGFSPYMHQQRAFERLAIAQPLSTLVATGTGSGKTECFLYPILNYCLQERRKGIKAIIVYPMNALATDQARRFAKEVAGLSSQLTVGMFTGDGGSDSRVMGPNQVITNQDTLRDNPPDILLTNYKMLDFLLMRPKDQRIWQHNLSTQDLLRYLVVDELHTFDGAQGTDLACLIRRLRDKLQLQDSLACVGTSATIGGESARQQLANYASEIFSSTFDLDSIILEDRVTVDEYLEQFQNGSDSDIQNSEMLAEWPEVYEQELLPAALIQGVYLRRQAKLWFSKDLALDSLDPNEYNAACVALGEYLHKHTAFLSLLRAASDLVDVRQLAQQWYQDFGLHSSDYALALIDSLSALISTARVWADSSKTKVRPLLQVRVQLWLRELRRMLASVDKHPRLTYSDDLSDSQAPLHLPLLHCRECHAAAWGSMRPQGEHSINPDLQRFYNGWFSQSPDSVLLYPLVDGEVPPDRGVRADQVMNLCTHCFELKPEHQQECQDCEQPMLRVWLPYLVKQVERQGQPKNIRDDDCPRCSASGSLMVLGSRAASLASVAISKIYGSHCNDDHKLIAFSDSVQDAAHRAGFFGARTYSQTVRQALALVVRNEGDNMALSRFIEEVPRYWQRAFDNNAAFVGTFIAPNMQWLSDYQKMLATQGEEVSKSLQNQVSQRLRWEALTELGLRSRIGRTLERSEVAVIQPDSSALNSCVRILLQRWQEELEQFRDLDDKQVLTFLLGFLHRLRQHGAFYDPVLDGYVRDAGETFLLKRIPWLPGYGFSARAPAALTFAPVSSNFQNMIGNGSRWYQQWFNKTVAANDNVFASSEYEQALQILVSVLTKGQWLTELSTKKDESAWMLKTDRWQVVTSVASFACSSCGNRQTIASQQQADWMAMPCMQVSCKGHYGPVNSGQQRQLAYNTLPKRLITSEHTGLLDGKERLAIEQSFIYGDKAWDVNLLSATPTLEMGIDIGDLSAVLLCSVPPAQANYLQRIGRAGRSNGNALALTIANGSNHDNYFYNEPLEMIAGDVATPGVFLNAMAVLERQLIAYCFDRWVATGVSDDAIPAVIGSVLTGIQQKKDSVKQSFPNNVLSFIDANQESLLERFLQMFNELDEDGQEHLRTFIGLDFVNDQELTSRVQGSNTPLSWRIVNRLQELLDGRESHRQRAAELKKKYDALAKQPKDEATVQLIDDLKRERSALLALINSINKQPTLNFFTDEGLLPNYAFPEEGVTLNSIIVRKVDKKENAEAGSDSGGVNYEQVSLKFQRPAQAALNELVPENVFYVSEHKISIEQVDLRLSKPSEWRMCPSCHYSEDMIVSGDKHSACPRCGDPYWADVQQKQSMLKLRQVYARANSRYDRISDDSDQREPKFFQRQLLIDIEPKNCTNAMRIDDPEVPFGFEFVRSAAFREINFGEQFGEQNSFSVAGSVSSKKGFQICKHCGMVQRKKLKKGQFNHSLDCKLARSEEKESRDTEDYFESLYLFRELKSEAVRILLPLADIAESEKAKRSFIAAINMGLKEYFHGAVQHLEVTDMQEPSTTGNKQYLVIYDRIPGGTGYLKQLMTSPEALFSMLEKALNKLIACSCQNEIDHEGNPKDGCYSCILAYRISRHRQEITRSSAVSVLSKILNNKEKLVPVDGLSEVPTNNLLDGALEERFVQALEKVFKVTKERVNNKPGYWVHVGDSTWELEPQVEFDETDGVIKTRADFVLRPNKQSDRILENEIVIYTDGFEYHWNNITDDLRKRLSLLRSGRKVWVFTWDDLAVDSADKNLSMPDILLKSVQATSPGHKIWEVFSKKNNWFSFSEVRGLLEQGSFAWLASWLRNPTGTKKELCDSALSIAFHQLSPRPKLEAFINESLKNTGEWCKAVLQHIPDKTEEWQVLSDNNHSGESTWQLLSYSAPNERASFMGDDPKPAIHVVLNINDNLAENRKDGDYKDKWRSMWQAFNVLQYAPSFSAGTQTGLESGLFRDLLIENIDDFEPDELSLGLDKDWQKACEFSDLTEEQLEAIYAITQELPEVGEDLIGANGGTILSFEMAWLELKVGLLVDSVEQVEEYKNNMELQDWALISLESVDWLEQLTTVLGKE